MAVRDILRYPHPALKQVARPLGDAEGAEARRVAGDLVDTMLAHPGCVGLAATQLGELVRVVVVDLSEHPKAAGANHGRLVLVNPVVVHAAGAHVAREGCLSIPHLTANVRRATEIAVEARTPEGDAVSVASTDFEARCLLHELDHLDGILFLDRVDSLGADVFRRKRFQRPEAGGDESPEAQPGGRAVLRVTRRVNQAFADRDLGALAGLLTDDVELRPPADLPDPGPFHGPEDVTAFLAAFREAWEECRVDVEAVLAADESRAVARLRLSARGSGSGIQAFGALVGAFWLRDGRVERVELGRDADDALARAGLARPG
jgi:peptide deformylase